MEQATNTANPTPGVTNPTGGGGSAFVLVDNGLLINEKYIKWLEKYDECIHICNRIDGCYPAQIHQVCKTKNPTSYEKLLRHFPSSS